MDREEFGWLIEIPASGDRRLLFLSSPPEGNNSNIENGYWSYNPDKAIRFARKCDAESVINLFLQKVKPIVKIVEHGWA
jgi:hypothetical protein